MELDLFTAPTARAPHISERKAAAQVFTEEKCEWRHATLLKVRAYHILHGTVQREESDELAALKLTPCQIVQVRAAAAQAQRPQQQQVRPPRPHAQRKARDSLLPVQKCV